jgi:ATP-dependent Clp protease ATP-binding subunit ClpA
MTDANTQKAGDGLAELFRCADNLERRLLKDVYGQDEAIRLFVRGYFDAEVMTQVERDRTAPRAVFMFAGPKGVGKSYLAEQAASALGLPFKRFEMSGLGDNLQYRSLIGGSEGYRYPAEGTLTGFVKNNPTSVILIDGVEKMHGETLEMAHEILRTGILRDDFLDEEISFLDTYVVFTTGTAYSPNAETISARMVTFVDLEESDLERIVSDELSHCCNLFEEQYCIHTEIDVKLAPVLLSSMGAFSGTKRLRKSVYDFFKNELFALRGLFTGTDADAIAENLEHIHFIAANDEDCAGVREIHIKPDHKTITIRLCDPQLWGKIL